MRGFNPEYYNYWRFDYYGITCEIIHYVVFNMYLILDIKKFPQEMQASLYEDSRDRKNNVLYGLNWPVDGPDYYGAEYADHFIKVGCAFDEAKYILRPQLDVFKIVCTESLMMVEQVVKLNYDTEKGSGVPQLIEKGRVKREFME